MCTAFLSTGYLTVLKRASVRMSLVTLWSEGTRREGRRLTDQTPPPLLALTRAKKVSF